MKRFLYGVVAFMCCVCLCGAALGEGTTFPFLGNIGWDTPEGEADRAVKLLNFEETHGYSLDESKYNYYGGKLFGRNVKWLSMKYVDGQLDSLYFFLLKGSDNYKKTVNALSDVLGSPVEGFLIRTVNGQEQSHRSLVWENGDTTAYLTGVNGNSPQKCKKGNSAFTVSVLHKGSLSQTYTIPTESKQAGTAQPVTIYSSKLTKQSNGTGNHKLSYKNNTDRTIDRVVIWTVSFDLNGLFIAPHGHFRFEVSTLDITTKAGRASAAVTGRMTGVEGVRSVLMAVVSYRFRDGETVEIPEDERVWVADRMK